MILAWTLCLALGAGDSTPRPVDIVPPALRALLQEQPAAVSHHQGYLKELARMPDLAASETAWWQASARPDIRDLDTAFDEAIDTDDVARTRFDAFYDQLRANPALRDVVENLLRTELDGAKDSPALARAVQYLRANPDVAMRFLQDPTQVRPLPDALREAYAVFLKNPEWMASLRKAYGTVLENPATYETVLPWWEELETLAGTSGEGGGLPAELYSQPRAMWLWHLRNINRARNEETRPWIRYWNRLIHRDPLLAEEYGPFISQLLRDPEQLRNHLGALQDAQAGDAAPWPPKLKPPALPPLDMNHPVGRLKQNMARPDVDVPETPSTVMPRRPVPPTPPTFPEFPSPTRRNAAGEDVGPTFPTFPEFPTPKKAVPRKK